VFSQNNLDSTSAEVPVFQCEIDVDGAYYRLDAIMDALYTFMASAVNAAIHISIRLNAMAENFTATMVTDRRKRLHGTLEAIEHMRDIRHDHFKGFVVVIPTCFTPCHVDTPP
jgi:hypothetical protein